MNSTLTVAIVFINLAMLFYTIGVWAERVQLRLKWWHLIFFWSGFIADTIGTTAMGLIAGTMFRLTFHGITGNFAILLMGFHAVWATWVLLRKKERLIENFHKFSFVVWIIWLIPMASGAILGAAT
jgi:uncharacterized repeat protein (TIGR03987 family)